MFQILMATSMEIAVSTLTMEAVRSSEKGPSVIHQTTPFNVLGESHLRLQLPTFFLSTKIILKHTDGYEENV